MNKKPCFTAGFFYAIQLHPAFSDRSCSLSYCEAMTDTLLVLSSCT
jgi:hypothetical protein